MPEREFKDLKIAVVHDHLGWPGGGERTALLLALSLGADFITAYADPDTYPQYQKELGPKFKTLTSKIVNKEVIRFFWLRSVFWKNRKLLDGYDILIASGQPAMEAVARFGKKGVVRLLYNHTPPRRIYDLFATSRAHYKWFLRPLFTVFAAYWRRTYLAALDRMDFDVANSENVRRRLIAYTGRDVNAVVWPPILTDKFRWRSAGDYFLSWARLDEAKRVEVIIAAFKKMPDQKLVVASGGGRLEEFKALASGAPNIVFVGWQEDAALFDLVGRSRAAIYIPRDEDAGMTHLEANAAGKPVLGVDEGGLAATIIEGETGLKIKADPSAEDVMAAVRKMTPEWCVARREVCEKHAANFSLGSFSKKIAEAVEFNRPDRPVVGVDASRWEDPRHPGAERRTGVEIYAKNLIENLAPYLLAQKCRPRFYSPRAIPTLPLSIQKIIPPRRFWTWRGLTKEMKRSRPDAFLTPSYLIPAHAPKNSAAVIHDIAFHSEPHKYPLADWLRQGMAWSANRQRARCLIAVSEATRNDIVRHFPKLRAQTVFVPPGYTPDPRFRQADKKANRLVYVGRLDRKKNIALLIEAFGSIAARLPDWQLDLIGSDGYGAEEIRRAAAASPAQDRIVFHGYVSDERKAQLLSEAAIFVQPSSSEGSALSLLEAWDAGLAAIVADIPVMREIAHSGARYFKPDRADSLAETITILAASANSRFQLAVAGRNELEKFSWKKTAAAIGQIILS